VLRRNRRVRQRRVLRGHFLHDGMHRAQCVRDGRPLRRRDVPSRCVRLPVRARRAPRPFCSAPRWWYPRG
jgi:hypothetical protein